MIINVKFSSWIELSSGVPQRSILVTLLFVIFINVLDDDVVNKILKFADDTKIASNTDGFRSSCEGFTGRFAENV